MDNHISNTYPFIIPFLSLLLIQNTTSQTAPAPSIPTIQSFPSPTPIPTPYQACCQCNEIPESGTEWCQYDSICRGLICNSTFDSYYYQYCCTGTADERCLIRANAICYELPTVPLCCACTNTTSYHGCPKDIECQVEVCLDDPTCCTAPWDNVCADPAQDICAQNSINPTQSPTKTPTSNPTPLPTTEPTDKPSLFPTATPTLPPTDNTANPSVPPVLHPTTRYPTKVPTSDPTVFPTSDPTYTPYPTFNPTTVSPSLDPSVNPTSSPSFTISPSIDPTLTPNNNPSVTSTFNPTHNPSVSPTFNPIGNPSVSPTFNPSISPSIHPTFNPSMSPSLNPTVVPSLSPTFNPSISPSNNPSVSPSLNPTDNPSISPSFNPTNTPSLSPTEDPSAVPSISPTLNPTIVPSPFPTRSPATVPTLSPTLNPTGIPSIPPTHNPSIPLTTLYPTNNPSFSPTQNPSHNPTLSPTRYPSYNASVSPTLNPTYNPTLTPSSNPTDVPSRTIDPTAVATLEPTFDPTFPLTNTSISPGCIDCDEYLIELMGIKEEEESIETTSCDYWEYKSNRYSDSSSNQRWRRHRKHKKRSRYGIRKKCTSYNSYSDSSSRRRRRRLSTNDCNGDTNDYSERIRSKSWYRSIDDSDSSEDDDDDDDGFYELCVSYSVKQYQLENECGLLNTVFLSLCNDTDYNSRNLTADDVNDLILSVAPDGISANGANYDGSLGIMVQFNEADIDEFILCLKNVSIDDNYITNDFEGITTSDWVILDVKQEDKRCTNSDGLPCLNYVFSKKCNDDECECNDGLKSISTKYIGDNIASMIVFYYDLDEIEECIFYNVFENEEITCSLDSSSKWSEFETETEFIVFYANDTECKGAIVSNCVDDVTVKYCNELEIIAWKDTDDNICTLNDDEIAVVDDGNRNALIGNDEMYETFNIIAWSWNSSWRTEIIIIVSVLIGLICIAFYYLCYSTKLLHKYNEEKPVDPTLIRVTDYDNDDDDYEDEQFEYSENDIITTDSS